MHLYYMYIISRPSLPSTPPLFPLQRLLKLKIFSIIIIGVCTQTHTDTYRCLFNFLRPISVVHIHMFKSDPVGRGNLLMSSSLEKTNSHSRSSHWLPIAPNQRAGIDKFSSIHVCLWNSVVSCRPYVSNHVVYSS